MCTQTAAPSSTQETRAVATWWEAYVGPPELGRNSGGDPVWSCKYGDEHSVVVNGLTKMVRT